MKGKIRIILTVLIIMCISAGTLFAGGQKDEIADDGKLKVAILLPGVITDQGWNTLAYNALKAMEKNLDAEIAYTENTPASDYEELFRGYANAGFDVIM
ncbi:MAG: BMP family ABC transporter substrate-binding protein, partial [Spirochaetales bacterium]|nr:BMP family ABC transporter substrate-binding protein [Spirochaetales bacterium]